MQPSSSPSSRDDHSKRKSSRHHSISSASTTATTGPGDRRRGRERAKTELDLTRQAVDHRDDLPLPQSGLRAAHTTTSTPLRLDSSASTAEKSSVFTKPRLPTVSIHVPSAPIPIPIPHLKEGIDCPITPLSARGDGHRFPLGRSLNPRYMGSPDNSRHVNYLSDSSDSSVGSIQKPQRDTLKTNLSPSMQLSQRFHRGTDASPQSTALRLTSLPRFHPANYQSPSPGSTGKHHRNAKQTAHGRTYSDAKQQIHQYQRDMIANATRAARLNLSPKASDSPRSPRLGPMGSPGPVTPMTLESEGDYLMARDTGSPTSKKMNGRDLVERLVQRENERRMHPNRAESLSPAVSPAGGPR